MTKKNLPASVQARLMNQARETQRPFQELLQYYAMERFLYRLSSSPHRARFVLKGGLMLHVWKAPLARVTRDVDLLGRLENSLAVVGRTIREVCVTEVEPDGLLFAPDSLTVEHIHEAAESPGVRVRFTGLLGKVRLGMQLDIGFGDVVVPGPVPLVYPTLLDLPAPSLEGYPRETVIAEKFQAMVFLGALNSRMKDFYDIWLLSRRFDFDGAVLTRAVAATFARRETRLEPAPLAFTKDFVGGAHARVGWSAFRKKSGLLNAPEDMGAVVEALAAFLGPVASACQEGRSFDRRWPAGGPWSGP
ncbi:nucleotidyl transferase AbiEii/AbiGii toxin family protein [Pyxidicoccus sp. MSG2]|uniref:nucleotidyl transferase AbiEii/AbiGii toxin family protein n=1 Tax=Pyxidicoccus sp. MSG2 TaxID=2996790 RepID=UPI00227000CF|nr:nucleotidyl transferase AbiEii/AbiGii toxin family protein [Pyxidicoccus sp. MSG2]MCY1017734.1 nucleotidyl transferase AbiEii/AbiGii toxin family protein [Pyxidicoccus sp. MSG2]